MKIREIDKVRASLWESNRKIDSLIREIDMHKEDNRKLRQVILALSAYLVDQLDRHQADKP